ncbi:OmpP1/FadL family transporter [Roseibium sp.]|uniref:OmpP1/FadL family transporter n=1 Tax=Roseibium sp. TaxID=1936156 RepID=UPI003A97A1E3
MSWALKKSALFATTAIAASIASSAVFAGAFALREQSAYYQGMSFAGNGTTGPSISSVFWNPATITGAKDGLTVEAHNSFIIPQSEITGSLTGGALGSSTVSSGEMASDAWIPATYTAYKFNEELYFGLGVNAPFGLATKPDDNWAGRYYSRSSEVFSVNVSPTIGYKFNDMISVGFGAQVQYIQVRLKNANPGAAGANNIELKGDDVGFGVTAGVTIKPMQGTEIGLGYRSAVWHDLEGVFILPTTLSASLPAGRHNIGVSMSTPEMITLSAKQRITDQFTLLGTVEWTNWSRLEAPKVIRDDGLYMKSLPFNYEDGWFFSVGGEYAYNDSLTLRAGVAYEKSPIDTAIRSTRLPDNNRWWLSAGATYNFADNLSFDVGYSHLIPEDTDIKIVSGHQDYSATIGNYVGKADAQVDIFSASLRYKW